MVSSSEARYYDFGRYRLDVTKNQLLKNNQAIPLTHKSVEILRFLIQNRGEILDKNKFFKTVWAETYVDETNLTQHIYRIRKALGDSENGNVFIETIPKYGYRFIGEVKEIFDYSIRTDPRVANKLLNSLSNFEKEIETDQITKPSEVSCEPIPISQRTVKIRNERKSIFISLLDKKSLVAIFIGAILSITIYQVFGYFSQNNADSLKTKSVLVLPFTQIGDSNDARLGLGTADAIISKLGSLREITVIPTESIINYAKKDSAHYRDNLFRMGRSLNADMVITGTIQREGDSARINVMFYRVNDKQQLCAAKFDEEFSRVFDLQDSISRDVLNKLVNELNEHEDHIS